MKAKFIHLFSLIFIVGAFQSCTKDQCEREITYVRSVPMYSSWDDIRTDITSEGPRVLEKPGKIYFYNNYIFINEQRVGIHIVDNSTPSSPQFVSFIPVPGNLDMAVRGNMLYADNYTDLLTLDLADLSNVRLIKRLEEAFPNFGIDPQLGVLTHYEQEEVTEIVDCEMASSPRWQQLEFANFSDPSFGTTIDFNNGSNINAGIPSEGIAGSFARFTLVGNYLYTVTEDAINVFDLNQIDCPVPLDPVWIGWGIETIFPYNNRLFIGSNSGMSIYDLSNPAVPEYISGYSHWTGCDPVFVDGNFAYVTIHSGQTCNGGERNQLDVLDISDIFAPRLERSFEMESPHGLSVKDQSLYLCEGEFGLKVFDVSNPLELDQNLLAHLKSFAAYDVIALPGSENILLLIGEDGFYQFDITDPSNPDLISHISVVR